MVVVYAALAEVDCDLLPTGAFSVVDKIKAPQTSTTTLAVQLSYCPMGLVNRSQDPLWQCFDIDVPNATRGCSAASTSHYRIQVCGVYIAFPTFPTA